MLRPFQRLPSNWTCPVTTHATLHNVPEYSPSTPDLSADDVAIGKADKSNEHEHSNEQREAVERGKDCSKDTFTSLAWLVEQQSLGDCTAILQQTEHKQQPLQLGPSGAAIGSRLLSSLTQDGFFTQLQPLQESYLKTHAPHFHPRTFTSVIRYADARLMGTRNEEKSHKYVRKR